MTLQKQSMTEANHKASSPKSGMGNGITLKNFNSETRPIAISQLQTEIQRLYKENESLKEKCVLNEQNIENLTFDLQFYQSRCDQLSNKVHSELITFDKYQSDLMDLKQELLQKDSLMTHSTTLINLILKNTFVNIVTPNSNETTNMTTSGTSNNSNSNSNTKGNSNSSSNNSEEGTNANDKLLRLNYEKIDDILGWHNFLIKFHQCIECIDQFEKASHRSRQRLKNMISIHSEKLKNLNLRNITHVTLKEFSNKMKSSFDGILSEQHLKEFQLSTEKQKLLESTTVPSMKVNYSSYYNNHNNNYNNNHRHSHKSKHGRNQSHNNQYGTSSLYYTSPRHNRKLSRKSSINSVTATPLSNMRQNSQSLSLSNFNLQKLGSMTNVTNTTHNKSMTYGGMNNNNNNYSNGNGNGNSTRESNTMNNNAGNNNGSFFDTVPPPSIHVPHSHNNYLSHHARHASNSSIGSVTGNPSLHSMSPSMENLHNLASISDNFNSDANNFPDQHNRKRSLSLKGSGLRVVNSSDDEGGLPTDRDSKAVITPLVASTGSNAGYESDNGLSSLPEHRGVDSESEMKATVKLNPSVLKGKNGKNNGNDSNNNNNNGGAKNALSSLDKYLQPFKSKKKSTNKNKDKGNKTRKSNNNGKKSQQDEQQPFGPPQHPPPQPPMASSNSSNSNNNKYTHGSVHSNKRHPGIVIDNNEYNTSRTPKHRYNNSNSMSSVISHTVSNISGFDSVVMEDGLLENDDTQFDDVVPGLQLTPSPTPSQNGDDINYDNNNNNNIGNKQVRFTEKLEDAQPASSLSVDVMNFFSMT